MVLRKKSKMHIDIFEDEEGKLLFDNESIINEIERFYNKK